MVPRYAAFDEFDCSADDMPPDLAAQRAAQYRWQADYIAANDEALSRHLLQKAAECERIALVASGLSTHGWNQRDISRAVRPLQHASG